MENFYFIVNLANGSISLTITEMVKAGDSVLAYLNSVCDGQNINSVKNEMIYKPRSLTDAVEVLTAMGGVQNIEVSQGFIPRGAIIPQAWNNKMNNRKADMKRKAQRY